MYCISKMTRQTLCIAVACIVLGLYGSETGPLGAVEANSFEAFDLTPKIGGLSFMIEPQLRHQHQSRQLQLQQLQQLQPSASSFDADQQADNDAQLARQQDQVKRASFKDVESTDSSNSGLRQQQQQQQLSASKQDLSRLIGLDQILESLAMSIPSSSSSSSSVAAPPPTPYSPRQIWRKNRTSPDSWRVLEALGDDGQRIDSGSFGQQVLAPSRPTPAPTFGSLAGARLAAARVASEQWPGAIEEVPAAALGNMLEGNSRLSMLGSPKSRKSTNLAAGAAGGGGGGGLLGFVWPSNGASRPTGASSSAAGGTGEPTPIFTIDTHHNYLQQKHLAQGNARKLGPPTTTTNSGRPIPTTVSPNHHSNNNNHHHRLGTEEVALHTPIHSHMGSDYEWKRVENSRSWNNLRGMWGKRAISEPFNDPESLRDAIIEQEARESEQEARKAAAAASASASASASANVLVDNNGDDGGPRQSRQIEQDEVAQRQQQQLQQQHPRQKRQPQTVVGPVAAM